MARRILRRMRRFPPLARILHSVLNLRITDGTLLAVATALALATPFLFVDFVPSTDLPQHLAQVRLLLETLGGQHRGALDIHWFSPNTLVYLLLWAMWSIFPPILAGKMTMLVIAQVWAGAVFVLARAYRRPPESAALASLLTFGASFYWGFMSFLIGWPLFALWLILLKKRDEAIAKWATLFQLAACALALLLSHALWFLAGIAVLLLGDAIRRAPMRVMARHGLAIAPTALFAIVWYRQFSAFREAFRFDTQAHWGTRPWDRLAPSWLVDASLGGVRGPLEVVIVIGIALWIVLSVATRLREFRTTGDALLGLAAVCLLAVALCGPDKYMNTIHFASRWFPPAVVLLLLALPAPKLPRGLLLSLPLILLTGLSIVTGSFWKEYESSELSGLRESLNVIPGNSRTLGLDFVGQSALLKGRPFLQIFAYAQVIHGGDLNFSFVNHQSGIVVQTDPPRRTWNPTLEWFPERVTPQDFAQFDIAIVNGTEELHGRLAKLGLVTPLTTGGRWRAYRCNHPSSVGNEREGSGSQP